MNLAKRVKVAGVWWKLFSIEYKTPDGTYSAYFYAVDAEHASYILADIKANGELRIPG
ncbi:hypothetical protein [Pseudomonas chlororaphis]|uniref:hypothetical protein n=1 Tax=Pseudomonas chlororaphis TaxID=587753 RepID=UPI001B32A578|nr:hypothetical protein [Pseudomonas chlororaphis]MBP5060218.1 hypothetical protein [Pseudomonas chlororaphis]MBP5144104.1 hypothetical protein [Pseudomonas chlororaphis]